jgi:hypothetical protein
MSERNGTNGKVPRRPRTDSHTPNGKAAGPPSPGPPAPGAVDSPSGPEDRPDGRTDTPGEPVVSAVTNNGHAPDGKFTAGNGIGHRFEKGNRFGKGNPNARRQHELHQAFLDAIHPDAIPALARRLQAQALSGDLDAAKLLLDRCLGRPSQMVALTDADGGSLGINVGAITTVVLSALSGPEHAAARVKIAADLMRLDDVRDSHES